MKIIGEKDDVRTKMSDSEILLIGYLATSSFNGNYHKADLSTHFSTLFLIIPLLFSFAFLVNLLVILTYSHLYNN